MRALVHALPRHTAPADLFVRLQVLASKERAADRRPGSHWRKRQTELKLAVENLMKPIALPAAGGLCAAILLFMALMPTFAMDRSFQSADVPLGDFTQPKLKALKPIGFHYGDAEVDLRIDEQGRIVNYSIVSGSSQEQELLRRSIENTLLFTTFTPATAYGIPIPGTIRLSFRSSSIEVKG